ncbi:MAG TPA: PASTA domain-containing protein [Blastocatellia bacterium]|nr:PASTA domain-containing protein [Blastocatellia bacterium]
MSTRISFNIVLKRLLTIAALVAAFLLSAGIVIYFAYGGREVKVPELIGRTQTEAQSELEGLGLRLRVTTSAPSDKVGADRISEQDPHPGMVVKTGQSVRVIISSGLASASPSPASAAVPGTAAAATPKPRPAATPGARSEDRKENRKPDNQDAGKKQGSPVTSGRPERSGAERTEKKDARPGN